MSRPASRAAAWLALLGLVVACPAAADIDVNVPAGLPPEWLRFLPQPTLTDLGRVPRVRRSGGRGSVEVLPPDQPRGNWNVRADTSFGFSGITTVDLPQHFPWSVPKPEKRPEVTLTGHGDPLVANRWPYPPLFPTHLYWLGMASLLRKATHPAQVSTTATVEYLILLGHPAYLAAANARSQNGMKRAAQAVFKATGPLPRARPKPRGGLNPYQKMVYRLALVEMASGYPNSPAREFCRRLMSLASEAQQPVLAYTRHPHLFVQRNAVSLLTTFDTDAASQRLRVLMGNADRVIRNRALKGLIDRQDLLTVPRLIAALTGGDRGLAVLAADGLGRIGDVRALEPLMRYADKQASDADALWAAIPALGRLGTPDKRLMRLLATLERQLRANKNRYREGNPTYSPPMPDRFTRAEVIAQMCRIALAGLGDARSAQAVLAEIKDADPKRDQRKINPLRAKLLRRFFARRGKVLNGIYKPNLFWVCEVLGRMGAAGNQQLLDVIEDATEEVPIRAHALAQLQPSALLTFLESIDKLTALAQGSDAGLIRAVALRQLERIDAASASAVARKMVLDYTLAAARFEDMPRDWAVIPAMRLLGSQGATDVDVLLQVIRRAEREQLDGLAARKAAKPDLKGRPARGGIGRVPLVTIPPVLEAALIEIGRSGQSAAVAPLLARLRRPDALGRAEACLALGAIGGKPALSGLIDALVDKDPWVRFCAYRSVRQLAGGVDHFCDWLFDGHARIAATAQRWRAWYQKTYP